MCGILFHCFSSNQNSLNLKQSEEDLFFKLIQSNSKRGPDAHNVQQWGLPDWNFEMHGFVLHMRGKDIMHQPVKDHKGNILCFNGEIFDGLHVERDQSDSLALSQALSRDPVESVMSSIRGPWAFIYWEMNTRRLYFGRDHLGRRSLLAYQNENELIISSTSCLHNNSSIDWTEVESGASIICIDYSGQIPKKSILPLEIQVPRINTSTFKLDALNELLQDFFPTWDPCSDFVDAAANFRIQIEMAICKRIETIRPLYLKNQKCGRVGILFSGGIDCTILAALSNTFVPFDEPIDLLNVAFENQRSQLSSEDLYNVPDRITGKKSFQELQNIYPMRVWNFVEINVTRLEYMEAKNHVIELMNPAKTVMDLSIAIAIWFASRGIGTLHGKEYTCPCKVLLSGLGADEQLGGYSRHAKSFNTSGWDGLVNEIQLDLDRISNRNLGRDDRIVSDHGKELRLPFLDEELIHYLAQLPINFKADLRFKKGVGDKLILRWILYKQLRFQNAFKEPKRAIQFGSRTAKMESNDKGHVDLDVLFKLE